MADEDITVSINTDISEAVKSLDKLADTFKGYNKALKKSENNTKNFGKKISSSILKAENKMRKSFKNIGKSLFTLKSGLAGVLGVFLGAKGLSAITNAASVQEDAVNNLNTAMKIAGDFSADAAQDFQDFAAGLQASTRFGDEVILQQLGIAKAFGATNDQAKEIVLAGAELAAATGRSIEETTGQVAKTLGGFAGELGERLPGIKELTREQLLAGDAAKLLIDQFSGSAAGQVATFGGAVDQTKNAFGDLLEELGFILTKNPDVIKSVGKLKDFFVDLTQAISDNKDEIQIFVSAGIEIIGNSFDNISKAFKKIKFGAILKQLRLLAVGVATFTAIAGGIRLVSSIKNLGLLKTALNGLKAVLSTAALKFTIIAGSLLAAEFAIKNFSAIVNRVKVAALEKQVTDLNEELERLADKSVIGRIKNAFSFGKEIKSVEEVKKALQETKEELGKLKSEEIKFEAGALQNAIAGIAKSIGTSISEGFDIGTQAIDDAADSAKESLEFVGPPAPEDKKEDKKEEERSTPFRDLLDFDFSEAISNLADGAEAFITKMQNIDLKELGLDIGDAVLNGAIGAAEGVAKNILKGADGARKFISEGAAGVAEAVFGEGAGKIAGPVVDALLQGPDAVEDMVGQFVDALPVLLDALAQAIPAVVTALAENVDEIIIALVKATPAIARALAIEVPKALLTANWGAVAGNLASAFIQELTGQKNVVFDLDKTKKIFGDFGNKFQSSIDSIGPKTTAFIDSFNAALEAFPQNFERTLVEAFDFITITLVENLKVFFLEDFPEMLRQTFIEGATLYLSLPDLLRTAFFEFIQQFGSVISEGFQIAAQFISDSITGAGEKFVEVITDLFDKTITKWTELIVDPLLGLPERFSNTFNDIIERIKTALNSFNPLSGGGGGGVGGAISRGAKAIGLQEGGTIPPGFGGDSFPANLSSGELVVPRNDTQDLRRFLASQSQGTASNEGMEAILAKILQSLDGGSNQEIRIAQDGLSEIILELDRRGERLTA